MPVISERPQTSLAWKLVKVMTIKLFSKERKFKREGWVGYSKNRDWTLYCDFSIIDLCTGDETKQTFAFEYRPIICIPLYTTTYTSPDRAVNTSMFGRYVEKPFTTDQLASIKVLKAPDGDIRSWACLETPSTNSTITACACKLDRIPWSQKNTTNMGCVIHWNSASQIQKFFAKVCFVN